MVTTEYRSSKKMNFCMNYIQDWNTMGQNGVANDVRISSSKSIIIQ